MRILETPRLLLRKMTAQDASFILELLNEPAFKRNIGDRNANTLLDAENYILSRIVASYEKNGYGLYVVELKETGALIGISGLVKRDTLEHADVGFAFLERYWNKGYATESGLGVVNYAKNELKFKRVLGITLPHNTESIKVLEKIGLRFERLVKIADNEPNNKLFALDFVK